MYKFLLLVSSIFFALGSGSIALAMDNDTVIDSLIEVIDVKPQAYDFSLNLLDAIEIYDARGLVPEDKLSLISAFWKQLMEYVVQVHEGDKQFDDVTQLGSSYYYQDESGVYSELGCYAGAPCGIKKVNGLDVDSAAVVSNNVIKDGQGQIFVGYKKILEPGIDVANFTQLAAEGGKGQFFTDTSRVYVRCGGKTLGGVFGSSKNGLCVTQLDPTRFVYEEDGNFATDGKVVYYGSDLIEGVIAEDFEFLTFEKRLADKMYNVYSDGVKCFGVEISLRSGYYLGGMVAIDDAYCS